MNNSIISILALLLLCTNDTFGFSVSSPRSRIITQHQYAKTITMLAATEGDETTTATDDATAPTKMTLEEKMKGWEASEEEIKAASLGGMTPQSKGADGFDIGLYIAFPIIVATSLLFAVFPFIMDKIDVTSVGPPPIV
mmetsp:Transcript_22931/g.33588  ORF Transcript_22931/g.33588 Transcript_22931/m.33588 type:complete len:139 (-) Transcript_22931:300-716(-)|eukprot:CAMPEP_0197238412 /NCGR_PEP_ID=MMETSP1429-20130617/4881_1 /TAXON_ID=49237 /ORGANISM="Chaetoceros  sp., Strain UNC1202" /LENGTH=138 /DNA_ID=CAMNT_0042697547 /DNA_START=66 /DNA_END=482 /DNA_ORIENTATION=+